MTVDVHVTSAGYSFKVTENGIIEGSMIAVRAYTARFRHWVYDSTERRKVVASWYRVYDRELGRIYLPRYDLLNFVSWITQHGGDVNLIDVPSTKGDPVHFTWKNKFGYRNDVQKAVIEGLESTQSGVYPIAASTGVGKTVSFIRSAETKNIRSLVFMPKRIEQWKLEFFKFAAATEKSIHIIAGRAELERLFMRREMDDMPDFIIASTATMRRYVTRHPDFHFMPPPDEFTDIMGIGMMGIDEFHEHLESNYMFMIRFNPAIWVPLTATFNKTDPFLNDIVSGFCPSHLRIGENEYHKFVDVYGYAVTLGHGEIQRHHYMGPRGYSETQFCKFLLKKGKHVLKEFMEDYFFACFEEHYLKKRKEGTKVMILISLIDLCYKVQKYMTAKYPDITSVVFVSGVKKEETAKHELTITTPGSGGTGTDIPGVVTAFSWCAVSQPTPLTQHLGRVRYDKNYTDPFEFVYFYFTRVHSHVDYEEIREPLYREKGLTYSKRNFPP